MPVQSIEDGVPVAFMLNISQNQKIRISAGLSGKEKPDGMHLLFLKEAGHAFRTFSGFSVRFLSGGLFPVQKELPE